MNKYICHSYPFQRSYTLILVLAVLLINISVIGLAYFFVNDSYLQDERMTEARTKDLSLVITHAMSSTLEKVNLSLFLLATDIEKQLLRSRMENLPLDVMLSRVKEQLPELHRLLVLNAHGDLVSAGNGAKISRKNFADRDYFLHLRDHADEKLAISKPVLGVVGGKWVQVYARRINNPDGSFAGIVAGSVSLEHFLKLFSSLTVGEHGSITLRDKDLAIVARYPEPDGVGSTAGQKTVSKEFRELVASGKTDSTYKATYPVDNIERIYSYNKLFGYPLYVNIGMATGDLLKEWHKQVARVYGFVSIFCILTFLSAFLLVRKWKSEQESAERLVSVTKMLNKTGELARVGGWEFDLATMNLYWSAQVYLLHEADPDTAVTVEEAISYYRPDAQPVIKEAVQQLIESGTSFDLELPIITAMHNSIWVRAQGEAVYNDGRIIRVFGTFQDISDRKQAEEERSKLEAQLQQAQKMESIGRLAGGVAHDFNNMLGVILGHAEMGLTKPDSAGSVAEHLKQISKAAERSADLTRQLLAFARKQTVVPKIVDLNDAVAGVLKMLQRLIGENVNLAWQPGHNLWYVKIDPSQFDQIMANLCVNARDAIKDTGRIIIETENCTIDENYSATNPEAAAGDYVRLSVSDDGSGMDKETLEHIFEPFYTTKSVGEGTGLGLATVYGAIKQNNGFINIYSEPGQGTTFSVYLPKQENFSVQPLITAVAESAARGEETVLLVEDDPSVQEITTLMLEGQGYRVLAATTPDRAVDLAEEYAGEIRMLMTDVIMPEMNGRDLANKLLLLQPQMKCLFMSGYTADVITHHGVLEEGVHFIQKPFNLNVMAAKVRQILDSGSV